MRKTPEGDQAPWPALKTAPRRNPHVYRIRPGSAAEPV